MKLIAEGKDVTVCPSLLKEASPVFDAMFSSGMKESYATEIEMPGKNFEALKFMVDFLRSSVRDVYIVDVPGKC